jgi:hypothetical protein
MASKKQTKTFQERATDVVEKEKALYTKAGIAKRLVLVYQRQGKTPITGRIGEWLLKKSGAQITTQYIDLQK